MGGGQGLVQAGQQHVTVTIRDIYMLTWELHFMHSLSPDTVPDDADEYRDAVVAALKALWPDDLRHAPPNLHRLIRQAHQRYLVAHPTHASPNRDLPRNAEGGQPLYAPAESALRAEYTAEAFASDFRRQQFHPELQGLAARRTAIHAAIAALVLTIPTDWAGTRAFFSPEAIAARLHLPPLDVPQYFVAVFKAQWVAVTRQEQQMLTSCYPLTNETYTSWLARYKNLYLLTRSEPPLTREDQCDHFMKALLSHYGRELYNYVRAAYTGLNPLTRTVVDLYTPASTFHRDHLKQAASTTPKSSSSTRAEQSPSRGRTTYPSSPNRPSNRPAVSFGGVNTNDYYSSPPRTHHRYSFGASTNDYYSSPPRNHHHYSSPSRNHHHYSHQHRHQSPEPHAAYAAAPHSTPSNYCDLCKEPHSDNICYYQCNAGQRPDWWRPQHQPLSRYLSYITMCQAKGQEPRLPAASTSSADRRPIVSMPTPLSNATAQRPQSTRSVLSTTATGRGPPRSKPQAPSYNNAPPPQQLHRQQEREERHAGYHVDADGELQYESEFAVMAQEGWALEEPQFGGGGGAGEREGESDPEDDEPLVSWASAHATTRAKTLASREAVAPEPVESAVGPAAEQAPLGSAVPVSRLHREPPPTGFAADQLPRGLSPAQLPSRVHTQLVAAQLGANQRAQALPLSMGVVPLAARVQKGGAGGVRVSLQQLVDYAGMGEFFKEALPLVVSGVGTERYAVDMSQLEVLMGAAQAVKVFGGASLGGGGSAEAVVASAERGDMESTSLKGGDFEGGDKKFAGQGDESTDLGGGQGGGPHHLERPTAAAADEAVPVQGTTHTFQAPSVTYLESSEPAGGITLACNGKVLARPRTMLDSGANINGIPLRVALACGAKFSKEQRVALQGTSRTPSSTLGRITTELDVCLCLGTAHSITLRLPLHVVDTGSSRSWDLLLGTGFLTAIGATINFMTSTLSFLPELINTPNADKAALSKLATHTIPLTTTTDHPSAAFLRDLRGPATGGTD